jgi:hypothetical protein
MKPAVIIAVIIGLLFCAIAVLYWIEPASALPSFFPGHAIGSTQHHTKHGILALALAIVSFIAAWFLSGPKQEAA